MTKKYGVIDLQNGEITQLETKEEAIELFFKRMIAFSLPYFHDTPFVSIEYNEDGTETWFNESEQEIEKILSYKELDEIERKLMQKASIPVAIL